MDSEYLGGYHIPLVSSCVTEPNMIVHGRKELKVKLDKRYVKRLQATEEIIERENVEAEGKQRRKDRKRKVNETETETGKGGQNLMAIFQGRDESYPDELNKLIQPLACQLCKSQMTSMKSAKDHYESKSHDRHISAWLAKNYTEVGLQSPPIKRLIKQGPTGPNAFHCNLCDLALTSMTHARQHYAGRKHQLVEQRRSKPSGAGYYNEDGKWVRTATKAEPIVVDDGRFGIGELFIKPATVAEKPPELSSHSNGEQFQQPVDDSLTCKICKISVTSASQIKMHLDGAKHQKNLRKQSLEDDMPFPPFGAGLELDPPMELLDTDLSMYRTPSGSYYCKLCNKAMNHISILQQHLLGKKHLRSVRQPVVREVDLTN